jgi:hypothetical protein
VLLVVPAGCHFASSSLVCLLSSSSPNRSWQLCSCLSSIFKVKTRPARSVYGLNLEVKTPPLTPDPRMLCLNGNNLPGHPTCLNTYLTVHSLQDPF